MYMVLCALGRMDEFGVADWGFETNHMCAQTAGSPFIYFYLFIGLFNRDHAYS